ncbi:hypothetical protein IW140_005490 [Coemansia sp. RSA 1813]|nr:hypothetical protein LPJ74_004699 [Coemansia sp. RSA 1843]KAJ2211208.1 hypothetical protein EV179_005665 [Coemansia sp. RSA 487]KAJ2565059.1 hypothetical protein IW140_005490 [Coemansia sp. RSA 1813]
MDVSKFAPRIREILQTSDLATISAKKVRRQLEHEMNASFDSYKGEIDEIIKQQLKKTQSEAEQQSAKDNVNCGIFSPQKPAVRLLSHPMKLSAELGAFLGKKYCTRADVIENLWKYIIEHSLQDPEDQRYILCDDKLKSVFQIDHILLYGMNKLISSHLIEPTPEESVEAAAMLELLNNKQCIL